MGALRSLRDAVRLSLIDRDRDPSRGEDTPPPRVETTARLRLDPDGTDRLVPDSVGTRAFGQRVLLAIHDAHLTGTWRRLKLCRNPQCLVAFWDNSRNTSGVSAQLKMINGGRTSTPTEPLPARSRSTAGVPGIRCEATAVVEVREGRVRCGRGSGSR